MTVWEISVILQTVVNRKVAYYAPKEMTFKIIGKSETLKVLTLAEAMNAAKSMNEFVTIRGADFEVCGWFGVDSVVDGKTPDGVAYTWNKASRIGRVKKEHV